MLNVAVEEIARQMEAGSGRAEATVDLETETVTGLGNSKIDNIERVVGSTSAPACRSAPRKARSNCSS